MNVISHIYYNERINIYILFSPDYFLGDFEVAKSSHERAMKRRSALLLGTQSGRFL